MRLQWFEIEINKFGLILVDFGGMWIDEKPFAIVYRDIDWIWSVAHGYEGQEASFERAKQIAMLNLDKMFPFDFPVEVLTTTS